MATFTISFNPHPYPQTGSGLSLEFCTDISHICLSDLKRLYWQAGVENKPTVFLFNDTQVVEEIFLEDINNILSSGEVPNLYKADEFEEVCQNALKTINNELWHEISKNVAF